MGRACIALCALAILIFGLTGPAAGGELIQNGSFETGDFGPSWVHGAYRGGVFNPSLADHVVLPDVPYSGHYSACLGFKYSRERRSAAGFMYQDVTIPADISSARLFFKVRQQGYDTDPYDPFRAQIRTTGNAVLRTVLSLTFDDPSYTFKDGGWVEDDGAAPSGVDMAPYAGQTVRVYFEQANTNDNLWETWAYVDDVSVVFRKFVDLAVDGFGDDLFGAIGSGGGGYSARSTRAGAAAIFDLDVENEGLDTDSYTLSAAGPPGWSVRLDAGAGPVAFPFVTPAIPAGGVLRCKIIVTPPAGAPVGGYGVVVDAVSAAHANGFDSAGLNVAVLENTYGADLAVEGNGFGSVGDNGSGGTALKTGAWGEAVPYALELRNTGEVPAAFRVSASAPAGASWRVSYGGAWYGSAFTTADLPPGGAAAMTLELRVPQPEPGGDYEAIVYARALPDTLARDSIEAVLRLLAPRVDMIVAGNGDGIYDRTSSGLGGAALAAAEAGSEAVFPVTIENEGGVPDAYRVSWVRPRPQWSAVLVIGGAAYGLPFTTPTLPPHASLEAELRVSIPSNAKVGTYSSILNAVSLAHGGVSESVTATVSVTPPGQIDLVIDGSGAGVFGPLGSGLGGGSARTVAPGDSALFSVDLLNLGGADAAEVSWNTPPGWRVTFDGRTSPVAGCPSGVYALKVVVPATSGGGVFDVIVDAQKSDRRYYVDSVRGRVTVIGSPRADLVIDGNGADVYGSVGSGEGGYALRAAAPGALYTAALEVRNVGSCADSFTVFWQAPAGWPPSSVVLRDGAAVLTGPFWTPVIAPASSRTYTVEVQVPASAGAGVFTTVIDAHSSLEPRSSESVKLITQTAAVVTGVVFDDRDHDGLFGAGDAGISGVSVIETASGAAAATGGDGRYVFLVPGGTAVTVISQNRSGFISLTPDTVGAPALNPGDTLVVDFADVPGIRLSAGMVSNGFAGAYVDFPHRLDAGTKGSVALGASADPEAVTMFFLDENEDGEFNGADRLLEPADLDMDPAAGKDHACVLLRVFVPAASPVGATHRIRIDAVQHVDGTPLTSTAGALDAVVVVEGTAGLLTLRKRVDSDCAAPGSVLTYTIEFMNTGVDSVQSIVILDPVSVFVEPMPDAFGPGMDVEWRRNGSPAVYLTLSPGDGDACDYTPAERLLRLDLSRGAPYLVAPGERGELIYRVIVK